MKKTIAVLLSMCLLLNCLSVCACAAETLEVSTGEYIIESTQNKDTSYVMIEDYEQYLALEAFDENTIYCGTNLLNPEDFLALTPVPISDTKSLTLVRLEFADALPNNVYSDFDPHVITSGSTATLEVNPCVWAPESFILEIGIYNWTTGENQFVLKPDGYAIFTESFKNLTAGTYSVYIRNRGEYSLSTGYMKYSLT